MSELPEGFKEWIMKSYAIDEEQYEHFERDGIGWSLEGQMKIYKAGIKQGMLNAAELAKKKQYLWFASEIRQAGEVNE